MQAWKRFLARDGLRARLSSIEIYDMEEKNALSMVDFILPIGSFPDLILTGRSADVVSRGLVDPNVGACLLNLHSIVVKAYAGDGISIRDLVRAYAAAPTAAAIIEVSWVECDNVSLEIRADAEGCPKGYRDANSPVKVEDN